MPVKSQTKCVLVCVMFWCGGWWICGRERGGLAGGRGEFTAFEIRNGTLQMELAVYTITIATQWGIVGH